MCGWCQHLQLPLPAPVDRYVLWKALLCGLDTLYRNEMQDFWPSLNIELKLQMAGCSSHLYLVLQSGGQMSVNPSEDCLHQSHHKTRQFPTAPLNITGLHACDFYRQIVWVLSCHAVRL